MRLKTHDAASPGNRCDECRAVNTRLIELPGGHNLCATCAGELAGVLNDFALQCSPFQFRLVPDMTLPPDTVIMETRGGQRIVWQGNLGRPDRNR